MRTKTLVAAAAPLLLLAASGAYVATRPGTYEVERSVTAAAKGAAVAAAIGDLQGWTAWSPWEPPDSDLQRRFSGAPRRPGHSSYWSTADGKQKGRTTIIVARDDRIELERELVSPTESLADFEIDLASDSGGTRITWRMKGENDFRAKLFDPAGKRHLKDVTAALEKLKGVVEAQAKIELLRVERSTSSAASPASVLATVGDLRRWTQWAPWEASYGSVNRVYGGRSTGTGSSYYWSGKADRGRLTILGMTGTSIELELAVDQPRPYSCDFELELTPEGAGTRVRWAMIGAADEVRPALYPTGDADRELGALLNRALTSMKVALEATASAPPNRRASNAANRPQVRSSSGS